MTTLSELKENCSTSSFTHPDTLNAVLKTLPKTPLLKLFSHINNVEECTRNYLCNHLGFSGTESEINEAVKNITLGDVLDVIAEVCGESTLLPYLAKSKMCTAKLPQANTAVPPSNPTTPPSNPLFIQLYNPPANPLFTDSCNPPTKPEEEANSPDNPNDELLSDDSDDFDDLDDFNYECFEDFDITKTLASDPPIYNIPNSHDSGENNSEIYQYQPAPAFPEHTFSHCFGNEDPILTALRNDVTFKSLMSILPDLTCITR